jgi:poly(A) polymerase
VRFHMLPLPAGERQARRFVHRRRELLPDLLKLMIADREAARGPLSSEANRRSYRTALSRIVAILEEQPAPEPLLTGGEVMELLGLEEGPRVGEALRYLSEARAVGDVTDREQAVAALRRLARARDWLH